MESKDLKGVIAAIATPFNGKEKVDVAGLKKLTKYVVEGGVQGIMTTGGTGEFPHLQRDEKKLVTCTVAEVVKGRVLVIAGTAACSTMEAIMLSEDARQVGADAVILTPPYYFKLPDESLLSHFREVAKNVRVPVVVYNNPLYTGNNLSPELIAKLSKIEGIIGLKQSNPDLGQLVEVIRTSRKGFSVLTGIDSQFYPALCVGGKGIFSTAACVVPRMMAGIYEAFQKEDHSKALAQHMRLQILNRFLEYDPGYVTPCKEALKMMGLPAGPVRRPLPNLTAAQKRDLKAALKKLRLM
ncbi:MAG: 4-hydroxy-tetrahydrodipicolinate synthase [Thermodesulfobacteriota bacterium]|jgi:4-hydroxy-tetrahydrodipicolinate synthase